MSRCLWCAGVAPFPAVLQPPAQHSGCAHTTPWDATSCRSSTTCPHHSMGCYHLPSIHNMPTPLHGMPPPAEHPHHVPTLQGMSPPAEHPSHNHHTPRDATPCRAPTPCPPQSMGCHLLQSIHTMSPHSRGCHPLQSTHTTPWDVTPWRAPKPRPPHSRGCHPLQSTHATPTTLQGMSTSAEHPRHAHHTPGDVTPCRAPTPLHGM